MTNRELYNMLKEAFPNVVAGYWEGFPNTEYSNAYIKLNIEAMIEKLGPPNCHSRLEPVMLTMRQVCLATDVIENCKTSEINLKGDAIHQLADCIDNFGEVEHNMNYTEHLLYYNLLNTALITLQKLQLKEIK